MRSSKLLNLEWSKGNDTKTQCNRLNISPLYQYEVGDKKVI